LPSVNVIECEENSESAGDLKIIFAPQNAGEELLEEAAMLPLESIPCSSDFLSIGADFFYFLSENFPYKDKEGEQENFLKKIFDENVCKNLNPLPVPDSFATSILLLLVFVPSAFATLVVPTPYEECIYFSVPMALAVFSILVIMRFIFFSERNKNHRKIFLILLLFLVIVPLSLLIIFSQLNIHRISGDILIYLIAPAGIITTIIGLIMTIFLIYKKNKFITKSIPPILVIDIATVILTIICSMIFDAMLIIFSLILFVNGMLGILSIIWLLVSLFSKNNANSARR
jgi:hypothetical protein